ncbi:MAG TPA: ABC transporter permease [Opitutaceae bacterium]|nr:ABC transporter permease [Opitutaceae bacterium]HRJ47263.1 ABC transporter permease [Opitutaceae bacterium]
MFDDLLQDLRYSARQLSKARGFAIVAILTLAIGIGATTAIFSIVNSVALRPLPYANPERLVAILQVRPSDQRAFAPRWNTVEELQKQATVFDRVAASTGMHGHLTGVDFPVRVFGFAVSLNYFSTLGVQPLLGRTFLPEEGIEGKAHVVILNHAYWLEQFNGSESVINREILLNDQPFTIIGVMPPGFRTMTGQMSSPKAFSPLVASTVLPNPQFLREVVGQLKPGVTLAQAQAEMNVMAERLAGTNPDLWQNLQLRVVPLHDHLVGDTSPTLYILMGAVGFLLLIACVNVANLLLARASSRQREIALRAALGASRSRVVRQLLVESVLLALIGGVLGILLAYWSMNALLTLAPVNMPRLDEVRLDGFALLVSSVVTMLTGIGFGLVPALQATKVDLTLALKSSGRSAGDGRQRSRLRNTLVVAEVALALVLLVGAGLLTRTYANLQKVEMGYNASQVHVCRVMLLPDRYPDNQARIDFADRALAQLAGQPGLVGAAFTTGFPHHGAAMFGIDIEDRPEPDPSRLTYVTQSAVTPDFFKVIGNRLLSGRWFNEHDRENTSRVAIVSEQLAAQHFPGANPVGKRIALVRDANREWLEIVGIVADLKLDGAAKETRPAVYTPFRQSSIWSHFMPIVSVRVGTPNPGLIVAAGIQKVDPAMPIPRHMPLSGDFDAHSIAPQKFTLFLLGVFSVVALFLAALGIYGVMSYTVSQRTNEIGVRMALGAQRRDILRLVLGQTARLLSLGLILGLMIAFAGSRLLASMLYEVSPNDPGTFIIISMVLAIVGTLASLIPARRATRVDPMEALRAE